MCLRIDIEDARGAADHIGIDYIELNISNAVEGVLEQLSLAGIEISKQTRINLPARIRMSTLYAVSQSVRGRVANTCNLSEDWIGYSTRYGDSVGDFAPIASFTVSECAIVSATFIRFLSRLKASS